MKSVLTMTLGNSLLLSCKDNLKLRQKKVLILYLLKFES